MGDLKLDFFFILFLYYDFKWLLIQTLEIFDPFLLGGLTLIKSVTTFQLSQNLTVFFGFKFVLSVAFLILIRGGTPRYRYDYLTKLGWLKFIGLVILVFFSSLLFFYLY